MCKFGYIHSVNDYGHVKNDMRNCTLCQVREKYLYTKVNVI